MLNSWEHELQHFQPHTFLTYIHYGDAETRNQTFQIFIQQLQRSQERSFKVAMCITTYDMILKDKYLFMKFNQATCKSHKKLSLQYMVIDEAHRLKNKRSMLFHVLSSLQSERRLLLTGTPLQNSLPELWSLLSFLVPELFDQEEQLQQWFNRPFVSDDSDESEAEDDDIVMITTGEEEKEVKDGVSHFNSLESNDKSGIRHLSAVCIHSDFTVSSCLLYSLFQSEQEETANKEKEIGHLVSIIYF